MAMLDPNSSEFVDGERRLALTPSERAILQCLLQHRGQVVTRDHLQQVVLGYHPRAQTRALDRTISRIRKKIEPDPKNPRFLFTEYGVGYRLDGVTLERAAGPRFTQVFIGRHEQRDRLLQLTACGIAIVCGPPGAGSTRLVHETFPDAVWVSARHIQTAEELDTHLRDTSAEDLVVLDDASDEHLAWVEARGGFRGVLIGPRHGPAPLTITLGPLAHHDAVTLLEQRAGRPLQPMERALLHERPRLPRALEMMASYLGLLTLDEAPAQLPDLYERLWSRLTEEELLAIACLLRLPESFELLGAREVLGPRAADRLVALWRIGLVEKTSTGYRIEPGARASWPNPSRFRKAAEEGYRRWEALELSLARERTPPRTAQQLDEAFLRTPAMLHIGAEGSSTAARIAALSAICHFVQRVPGTLAPPQLDALLSQHTDVPELRLALGRHRLRNNLLDFGRTDLAAVMAADGPHAALAQAVEAVRLLTRDGDLAGARRAVETTRQAIADGAPHEGEIRLLLARTLQNLYAYEEARAELERARPLFSEARDLVQLARTTRSLAYVHAQLGESRRASNLQASANALHVQLGRWGKVETLADGVDPMWLMQMGRLDEALAVARNALSNAHQEGLDTGYHQVIVGLVELDAGYLGPARKSLATAAASFRSEGHVYNLGSALAILALTEAIDGDLEAAARHHEEAQPFVGQHGGTGHTAVWAGLGPLLGRPVPSPPSDPLLRELFALATDPTLPADLAELKRAADAEGPDHRAVYRLLSRTRTEP